MSGASTTTLPRGRVRATLAVLACLVLLGLVSALRIYFGYEARGRPVSLGDALGSGLLEWLPWAPLLPGLLWLTRRFDFGRGRFLRSAAVHVLGGALASGVVIVLFGAASAAIRELRFGEGSLRAEVASAFFFKFHTGFVAYWAALFGFLAAEQARRTREEALRRERQERALAEARLAAVQAQLAPHFLFNTLNAIAASLHDAPDAAERMLARLGSLLRTVLARREEPQQSLQQELEFLEAYVDLQRERFGPRLAVELAVEPDVLSARVPTFLLQPLVENAIQHGLARGAGPVTVRVVARRRGDALHVAVEDDGPGFEAGSETDARRGVGLESVRERLHLAHGERGRFELGRAPGGGASIRLSFPMVPA